MLLNCTQKDSGIRINTKNKNFNLIYPNKIWNTFPSKDFLFDNLAYLSNIFLNPILKNYCIKKGAKVNEDLYSLSELVQWIWRSSIREGNDINLYIPSSRMRALLVDWLDGLADSN